MNPAAALGCPPLGGAVATRRPRGAPSGQRQTRGDTPRPAATTGARAPPMACKRASVQACRSVQSDVEAQAPAGLFLDEEAMVESLGFPIAPQDLIGKAKAFLVAGVVDKGSGMGELMADEFRFVAPVVGPLPKDEFLKALAGFDILEGIPDIKAQNHHFRIDPFEPGRVWFTSRMTGTHTGTIMGVIKPTGIVVDSPPQQCSLTFDTNGKITKYTVGYSSDREIGNTGGLGGIFGILYAVGSPLPFPEAQPWKKSKRYSLFQWFGRLTGGGNKPAAKDGQ